MRQKNWGYAITSFVLLYCTAIPPFAQEADENEKKPRRRHHIPRSEYAEVYKETFTADNYAERYRKNYRHNPIFTSSADRSHFGSRRFDDHDYHDDKVERVLKPKFFERGRRQLNVPQIPTRTVSSHTPSFDYRLLLQPIPLSPSVYQLLEERQKNQETQIWR